MRVLVTSGRRLLPAATVGLTLACASCGPEAPPAARPARSLLVVCIDTLRPDHVGAYGHERETTPTLDDLAGEGVLFTQAYAHSNWTVPATASLLTGLLPSEHGAGIEGDVRALADDTRVLQLRPGTETLATLLKAAGLRTGLFSANPFLFGRFTSGFDTSEVQWRDAEELTAAALAWLGGVGREPFFLYLQYMDLHQPIEPPPAYFEMFPVADGGPREKRHGDWSYGQLRKEEDLLDPEFQRYRAHRKAVYDGALRYVDDQVRRILLRLAELGVADETAVVVTSDHGEEFWDHALEQSEVARDPRGIWGIGHGHAMFEEVLRVPLILAAPGLPEGRRVDCPARHVDVLPTVLELLGLPPASHGSGRSLVPATTTGEDCPEVPIVAESPAYGPDSRAVIWKRRKLIVRSDGVEYLFDLRRDPEERHNLAAERPRLVTALRLVLERELAGSADLEAAQATPLDEETKRELRALGYLE